MAVFPFCPGVDWKIYFGMPSPKLPNIVLDNVFKDRKPVICCSKGGLLEAYFSCAYIEMLLSKGMSDIRYLGPYKKLITLNGLAEPVDYNIDFKRFNLPLFMDKKDGIYINVTHSYLSGVKLNGDLHISKLHVFEQLKKNMFYGWAGYPKIRKTTGKYSKWVEANNFSGKRYILYIDGIKSIHKYKTLHWGADKVRVLAGLLRPKGISVVWLNGANVSGVNGLVHMVPFDEDMLIGLIKNSIFVLSPIFDIVAMSAMMGKIIIYDVGTEVTYNMYKGCKYLGIDTEILDFYRFEPARALDLI